MSILAVARERQRRLDESDLIVMRASLLEAEREHNRPRRGVGDLMSPDAEEEFEDHYLKKGIQPETFRRRVRKARYLDSQIRKDHMLEHFSRLYELRKSLFKTNTFTWRGREVKRLINKQGRFVSPKVLTPSNLLRYAQRHIEQIGHSDVIRAQKKLEKKLLREALAKQRARESREVYLRRLLAEEMAKGRM